MNKLELYANELKRTVGEYKALKIAEERMKHSAPSNWSDLPVGPIFYKKPNKGNVYLDKRQLSKTHGWWTDIYHILKKKKWSKN